MTDQSSGLHSSLTPQDVRQIKILQIRCLGDGPQDGLKEVLIDLMGSMEWTDEGVDEWVKIWNWADFRMLTLTNGLKEYIWWRLSWFRSTSRLEGYKLLLDSALGLLDGHKFVFRIIHNITKKTAAMTSTLVIEVGKALDGEYLPRLSWCSYFRMSPIQAFDDRWSSGTHHCHHSNGRRFSKARKVEWGCVYLYVLPSCSADF